MKYSLPILLNMNLYFVVTGNKEELEVIRQVQPSNILISYWYFKNKPLAKFCEDIGYKPSILLDSGAYSAFTKGKSVNIIEYMDYIKANSDYLHGYISLDVIGDSDLTLAFYKIMRLKGLNPIPVYHYGEDESVLEYYVTSGAELIALGGTVPIRNKLLVSDWCTHVHDRFPHIKLHLLGSSSKVIRENEHITSCDSSSWYMMAVNGFPKEIIGKSKEAKIDRAKYQMYKLLVEVL